MDPTTPPPSPEPLAEQLQRDAEAVGMETKPHPAEQTLAQGSAIVLELGFIIAIPVFILGFSGALLDKKIGTTPVFMMVGFAISLAVSSYGVYRMIKRLAP